MSVVSFVVAGVFGAALILGSAKASTLKEGDGNFSDSWVAPTVIPIGTTEVSGTGAPGWAGGDRLDVFHFSGLSSGGNSIVVDFSLIGPYRAGGYANGGGEIYYSYVPFTGSYYVEQPDGRILGSQDLSAGVFDVTYNPWDVANASAQGTSSFTLGLGEVFAGDLFMALDFTFGDVSYNIKALNWATSDVSASPSPVPLPAPGLLLLAGFASLGFVATRRKRA